MQLRKNSRLRLVLAFSVFMLIIAALLVCRFDYLNSRDRYLDKMNTTSIYIMNEYKNLTENFWQYYLPLYSNEQIDITIINDYFTIKTDNPLTPLEQRELLSIMRALYIRADDLCWIALYSPSRRVNYLYTNAGVERLDILPDDFPYLSFASSDGKAFKNTLGGKAYGLEKNEIVLVGGSPLPIVKNPLQAKMLFGLNTQKLDDIIGNLQIDFSTLRYYITENSNLIYTSCQQGEPWYISDRPSFHTAVSKNNKMLDVYPLNDTSSASLCYYTVEQSEIMRHSLYDIRVTALFMLFFIATSIILYITTLRYINLDVTIIQKGLALIGNNNLEYRLPLQFRNDSFRAIAMSINQMTETLQRTVARSYQFELRQRDHEMAELMAKFSPHFLYNTLDLLRARCMRSGDAETAELISHVSSIFRGLINPNHVVTLREELAFGEHYLRLFRARYGEQLQIHYNIDTNILDCQIIRNIFQPLIENYFEHGFISRSFDNRLLIAGHIIDKSNIELRVEDNGFGISEEKLATLWQSINSQEQNSNESYGLKNLHQRIKLYYGNGYGLKLVRNEYDGLTIIILIRHIEGINR